MTGEVAFTYETMTTRQKVAALLIALGPTTASEILKNIKEEEILEQLTFDIASLNKVPNEILNQILEEFHSLFLASFSMKLILLSLRRRFRMKTRSLLRLFLLI